MTPTPPDGVYGALGLGLKASADELRELRAQIEQLRRDDDERLRELWERLNGTASQRGLILQIDRLTRQMRFVIRTIKRTAERRDRAKEKRRERDVVARNESRRNRITLVIGSAGLLLTLGRLIYDLWP